MTKTMSRHLLDILAEVPDFRNNRGKRHPLSAILGLAVIAMRCGSGAIPFHVFSFPQSPRAIELYQIRFSVFAFGSV